MVPSQPFWLALTRQDLLLLLLGGRRPRYNLDSALVDCGKASLVKRCSGWDEGRGYRLAVLRSGVDRDTAGVDALLRYQVVLGVDSAGCCRLAAILLRAAGVADNGKLRIRRALQVQGDIVEASLGFVVYTGRTLLVTSKVIEQSAEVVGAGGGGGAFTVTVAVQEAD